MCELITFQHLTFLSFFSLNNCLIEKKGKNGFVHLTFSKSGQWGAAHNFCKLLWIKDWRWRKTLQDWSVENFSLITISFKRKFFKIMLVCIIFNQKLVHSYSYFYFRRFWIRDLRVFLYLVWKSRTWYSYLVTSTHT